MSYDYSVSALRAASGASQRSQSPCLVKMSNFTASKSVFRTITSVHNLSNMNSTDTNNGTGIRSILAILVLDDTISCSITEH